MKSNSNTRTDGPLARRKRKSGGGRKRKLATVQGLGQRIAGLIPTHGGGAFQWTTRSLHGLVKQLNAAGDDASGKIVSNELHRLGYALSRNRKLPGARRPCDVDSQFEILSRAVAVQKESGDPVILLTGNKAELPRRFVPDESAFHHTPPEIARLDENTETVKFSLLHGGSIYAPRLRSDEEREAIQQQKRGSTILKLDELITDRDGGLFTAAVLEHWWRKVPGSLPHRCHSLLLLTHGPSPDIISSLTWQWAMDRLSKKLGITVIIGRVPPAIWRCVLHETPLFSFKWVQCGKTNKGFGVKGTLLCRSPYACNEITSISTIGRQYPKTRSVSKRVRESFAIRRGPQYDDWNYSFIGAKERHD